MREGVTKEGNGREREMHDAPDEAVVTCSLTQFTLNLATFSMFMHGHAQASFRLHSRVFHYKRQPAIVFRDTFKV